MHLLAAQPGAIDDGSAAVDLGQTPGDIVVLSAADTELASFSAAQNRISSRSAAKDFASLRLASLLHLGHNMSVDLYVEQVVAEAKLVVVRLLGGRGYWPYGVEQIAAVALEKNIPVAFLPGDDAPDAELATFTTLTTDAAHRLWQYCVQGGIDNAEQFLRFAAHLIGFDVEWREPRPLLRAGLYWPGFYLHGRRQAHMDDLTADWKDGAPVAALVFYRALVQAGNLTVIDDMIAGMVESGLNPLPIFVSSLKEAVSAATVAEVFSGNPPDVILNATGFAVSVPGGARQRGPFDEVSALVLQVVFAGSNEETWRTGSRGLSARDIAMNVALPEVDGRVLSRAVSFKGSARRDPLTQTDIVTYEPLEDRIRFVSELAYRWAWLRNAPEWSRKIALILANYPNRDGRMGNGVGLDTPAACVNILNALNDAEYDVDGAPQSGADLIARLQAGPTNAAVSGRRVAETLSLADYSDFFAALPAAVQRRVTDRWGAPENDPFYMPDDGGRFAIPVFVCGNVVVGLQPARGYNIDPQATYHDPDLVPPHGYFAFYAWLREDFDADAIVHVGKHGNLEWLPGKALALSEECFPEAALGAVPHLYPFIVNDPGEGTQAKRRAQAVIIDHLTPPLTRAESYGPLADLERLVDEYYEAAGVDPRRTRVLKKQILALCQTTGLDSDCGIDGDEDEDAALGKLDNYLCELKEMQIRDGLHVFGESPTGDLLASLLVALLRVPRGNEPGEASLIRALADDLALGQDQDFDPLDCVMGENWDGPKPDILSGGDAWRTKGDTVERLEALALDLVTARKKPLRQWKNTAPVLAHLNDVVRPAVAASGDAEMGGLLRGLDGCFVEPGPSGAPTRGRTDVLPTGRNFYSIDSRTVPTPAAWTLGWKSASLLVERYLQEHGAWPRAMALSAWGTSNMRTGGDDIAQALALMGVQPTWDAASRRLTGFEVMPLAALDRPRVDVTLRVSGFFRDAFPALIDLFDSAARAVAAQDESPEQNPLAHHVARETKHLVAQGMAEDEARLGAGYRVFGSKPGAYGAGLQALIDEKGWETDADLARAYVAWGGYAYGAGSEGRAAHGLFETRLGQVEAVIHNQDNREHDLLDSDDYYQFEGGMTAAVRTLSGDQPAVYHADHSRPESPRIRTLEEEISRVVRARVVNPKWIKGVMRHGYKGAFEMAATVDYLFAFSATARCVRDHHFDAVFDAYLGDDTVRDFLAENNPAVLKEMSARLLEAQARGLWKPKLNSAHDFLSDLAG